MKLLSIFDQKTEPTRTIDIIKWWERKRILYNLIVGLSGLLILAIINLFGTSTIFLIPLILFYGLAANFFYTLGWMIEIGLREILNKEIGIRKIGPALLYIGIVISLMMNLIFGLLTAIYWDDSFPLQD